MEIEMWTLMDAIEVEHANRIVIALKFSLIVT